MQLPSSDAAVASTKPAAGQGKAATGSRLRLPRLGLTTSRRLAIRIGSHGIALNLFPGKSRTAKLHLALPYSELHGTQLQGSPLELVHALEHLAGALSAFQAKMTEDKLGNLDGSIAEVTIDDAWMLYDVVRADLRPLAPGAADGLINASLADVAGVDPSELLSRWQPQGASAYTFACGLPSGSMPLITQALRERHLAVGSVTGDFVRAFNAARSRIDPECAVVALVRHAGAQVATVIEGNITSTSFEFGVRDMPELEARARSLLRVCGVGVDRPAKFYALGSSRLKVTEPWIHLETHA